MSFPAGRTRIWLAAAAALAFVTAANAHLLYVAWTSQPQCVAHLRPGERAAGAERFSAAVSSCAPDPGPATAERR